MLCGLRCGVLEFCFWLCFDVVYFVVGVEIRFAMFGVGIRQLFVDLGITLGVFALRCCFVVVGCLLRSCYNRVGACGCVVYLDLMFAVLIICFIFVV